MRRRAAGFSLVELLIAMAIVAIVTASVFGLMNPSQGSFSVQPEAADMQQRLRVATDMLFGDLVAAGAGSYAGAQAGSLNNYFAPVLPFRQGAIGDDAAGTYRTDTITLLSVGTTNAQTALAQDLAPGSGTVIVKANMGCPIGMISCGFSPGDTVLLYDGTGNFDIFTLTAVSTDGGTMTVSTPADAAATTFKSGSTIVKVVDHTYFLKSDPLSQLYQLMRYDGGANADVPAVDDVVGLTFEVPTAIRSLRSCGSLSVTQSVRGPATAPSRRRPASRRRRIRRARTASSGSMRRVDCRCRASVSWEMPRVPLWSR